MNSLIAKEIALVKLAASGICTELTEQARNQYLPSTTISRITRLSSLISDLCELMQDVSEHATDGKNGEDGKDGKDGYSPKITVSDITDGHRVQVQDAYGSKYFDITDGKDGKDGENGYNGYSPKVTVTNITGGHRVQVQTASGIQQFDVLDGKNGTSGKDGKDGTDGHSPTITVTDITGGHRVQVQTASGTQQFDVIDGKDGKDGTDGHSPTITVTDITGGHQVQVQDADGIKQFDVMNGEDGYSPRIVVNEHDTGYAIGIYDAEGYKHVTLHHGADGDGIADWDAAEDEDNHVKNRTHYKEVIGTNDVILEATNVTFPTGATNVNGFVTGLPEAGDTCIVKWKGKEYKCKAFNDDGYIYIGNGALAGSSITSDEPFCIVGIGYTRMVFKNTDTVEAVAFSVTGVQEIIYHKLPAEYLPDNIGSVKTVNGNGPDATGNVEVESGGVKTVNGKAPDNNGNVEVASGGVKTVNGKSPDNNGNVQIATSGDGGPADWNAAAGEVGYVLNRTHYKEDIPGTSLVNGTFNMSGTMYRLPNVTTLSLALGATYRVVWNGTVYNCVAYTDEYDFPLLGGTDYPFLITDVGTHVSVSRNTVVAETITLEISIGGQTVYHKLDRNYLPDDIGGADWNAAEGEPGHVLNRTHWVENGLVEVRSETTIALEEGVGELSLANALIVGETYTINWNGTEYSCVAQDLSAMEAGAVGLGDLTNFGLSGNGEPFIMVSAYTICTVMGFDGSTETTISIYYEGEKVHKIDTKFLPDEATNVVVITTELDDAGVRIASHSGAEISLFRMLNKAVFLDESYNLLPCCGYGGGMAQFSKMSIVSGILEYTITAVHQDSTVTTESSYFELTPA